MKAVGLLLQKLNKKDKTSTDRLDKSKIRSGLEAMCDKHLETVEEVLEFEALPSTIGYVVEILEEPDFVEKYDFEQTEETIFIIKKKDMGYTF